MSVRQRLLVGGLGSLAVVGTAGGVFLAQAPEHAATEIQVEDTAGILYEPDLRAGIEQVRFYEPTTVAVFTHEGGTEALTDDLALNDAVLDYARESRTDWLSDDEQTWADDLYIFAVDPEGRLVGTYFGDNRAVPESAQLDIQDETKDDLGAGQWTDGSIVGVEEAADRMNAPFIRSTGGIIVGLLASAAALVGAGTYAGVGMTRARRSRAAREEGDRSMANVVRDQEETELHAHLIPEDSRYGGLMLGRYDEYTRGVRELTELGNRAKGIPERDYDRAATVATLTTYRDKAKEMDGLDDVIADSAAFLNRDRVWVEAWERQVAPLRADLEGTDALITDTLPEGVRGEPETQTLREFSTATLGELDRMRQQLEDRELTPDDALDRLKERRDELSGHLDALAGATATAYSDDSEERKTMKDALRSGRRSRTHEPTILATTNPTWTWFALSSFHSGYAHGESEVQQARSQASSGSSSGYSSSSGGSFSGAGSSSRF